MTDRRFDSPEALIEFLEDEDVDHIADYFRLCLDDVPSLDRDRYIEVDGVDIAPYMDMAIAFGQLMAEDAMGETLTAEDYEDVGDEGDDR